MKWHLAPLTDLHLTQRPCYQRGSPCQDPAGNRTTWRPPDRRKETQTEVVWSYFPFIRSGQNHLPRHSERRKKARQAEKEVGRQHQGMDRPGVRQVPEGSGERGKLEETAKSSVVSKRLSRLGDRWWWWWCLTWATIDESIVPLESAVIISGIDRLQHRSHLSAGTSWDLVKALRKETTRWSCWMKWRPFHISTKVYTYFFMSD